MVEEKEWGGGEVWAVAWGGCDCLAFTLKQQQQINIKIK